MAKGFNQTFSGQIFLDRQLIHAMNLIHRNIEALRPFFPK